MNTASKMDEYGEKGQIQVTERFKEKLIAHPNPPLNKLRKWEVFSFTERGEIEIKGKDKMRTWLLNKKIIKLYYSFFTLK